MCQLGCVSDAFGYLGENLSEPKPNVIQIFHFGTGCEPKPYIQCTYIVRPVPAGETYSGGSLTATSYDISQDISQHREVNERHVGVRESERDVQ